MLCCCVVVVVQMCQDKDVMIDSQSSLVSGLRNMTRLQDRLGKAKDAALKILQKTVYEMVEKISQCRDPVVAGLRAEIKALQDKQDPLEKIVERMHSSLEAFKSILSYKQTNDKSGTLNQVPLPPLAALTGQSIKTLYCNWLGATLGHKP